jgi:hypothetical protein
MRPGNKRKKRTRAEQKDRQQRNGAKLGPSYLKSFFMAVTEEQFADRWSGATWKSIVALCGDHVDGEEICYLAETILSKSIDIKDRAAIEVIAAAMVHPRTALFYRPQLIEAAILAAADPVFIAESGPDAPWRKEEPLVLFD